MPEDISKLQKYLGFKFKNLELLNQAVVHRSYLNEHPDFPLDHNERLEFLGDAVLELVVTEHLFTHYPNPEGELTNWRASLVNSKSLSESASDIHLNDFMHLSRGESQDANSKARQYILADAFEAVIGAIYMDQGWDPAKVFIHQRIIEKLEKILKNKSYLDPKTRFQECAQEKVSTTPHYEVLEETGPDHDKKFKVGVYLGKQLIAEGTGSSKQEAQVNAAENGLKVKNWE